MKFNSALSVFVAGFLAFVAASCVEKADDVRPSVTSFTLDGNDYLTTHNRGDSVLAEGSAVDNSGFAQGQFHIEPRLTAGPAGWQYRALVEASGNELNTSRKIAISDTARSGIYQGEFIVIDNDGNSQYSPHVQLLIHAPGYEPSIQNFSVQPVPDIQDTIALSYGDSLQFTGLVSDTAVLSTIDVNTQSVSSGSSLPGYSASYNLTDSIFEASLDSLYFGPINPGNLPAGVPEDIYQINLVAGNDNGFYNVKILYVKFE